MPSHAFQTLGSQPLSANGNAVQSLSPINPGPVKYFGLVWTFSLISTAAAFALNILTGQSAGAVGSDDVDTLMDALISTIKMQMDAELQQGIFKPSVWRRILGYLNTRDFTGSFIAGGNVPASNTSPQKFVLIMNFPVSLETLFADGQMFNNGSARMASGRFELQMGSSLTPTVVLTHGSAVVSSLSENLNVFYGAGQAGDVGHVWQAEALNGIPNTWELGKSFRLGLFDQLSPASNTGSNIIVEDYINIDPFSLQSQFQNDRYPMGGYDVSQALTPYIWLKQKETFLEYAARTDKRHYIQVPTGVSQLNLYDIWSQPPSESIAARVAQAVGGGGPTHTSLVAPPTMTGLQIPPGVASLVPLRVLPGTAPAAMQGATAKSPSTVGQVAGRLQALHNQTKAAKQKVRGI